MSEHEEVSSDARKRALEMGVKRQQVQRQGSLPREIEDSRRDVDDFYERGEVMERQMLG